MKLKIEPMSIGADIFCIEVWSESREIYVLTAEPVCASADEIEEGNKEIARIVEAYPDLLAACKSILAFLTGDAYHEYYYQAEVRQLRAAIAKAGTAKERRE